MNFARDVVDAAPPARRALVALGRDGSRAEWTFGEVADAAARAAGTLAARGVGREHVVMTLVGNRPEWVLTMLACFRLGGGQLGAGHDQHVRVRRRLAQHAEVALVAHDQPRLRNRQPGAQVRRAQLLGAGKRDGAEPEAGEHRQHPFGSVADQRHHHVPARHPAGRERARRAGGGAGDLAEAPLRSRAAAAQGDERPPRGRGGVDHVASEVHGGREAKGLSAAFTRMGADPVATRRTAPYAGGENGQGSQRIPVQ